MSSHLLTQMQIVWKNSSLWASEETAKEMCRPAKRCQVHCRSNFASFAMQGRPSFGHSFQENLNKLLFSYYDVDFQLNFGFNFSNAYIINEWEAVSLLLFFLYIFVFTTILGEPEVGEEPSQPRYSRSIYLLSLVIESFLVDFWDMHWGIHQPNMFLLLSGYATLSQLVERVEAYIRFLLDCLQRWMCHNSSSQMQRWLPGL